MKTITKKYSKTTKYNIRQIHSNPGFLSTYKDLLEVRNRTHQKTQSNCFFCGKKFVGEDLLGLLMVEGKLNKLAHRSCCEELEHLPDEEG